MKLYFHTKQLPGMNCLTLTERLENLRTAETHFNAPEKLLLNLIKLIILVPVFVFILRSSDDMWSLLWAGLFILLYPLLLKPVHYSLCAKYLKNSINRENK